MFHYRLRHEHKYGDTYYRVDSPIELRLISEENTKALADVCGIDFEPEKGEFLFFDIVDDQPVTVLTRVQAEKVLNPED